MRVLAIALLSLAVVSPAHATTTRCYWIGDTYTCQTYGGSGGITTTRCTVIGGTTRCTQY